MIDDLLFRSYSLALSLIGLLEVLFDLGDLIFHFSKKILYSIDGRKIFGLVFSKFLHLISFSKQNKKLKLNI